ncbi:MAG: hypothetical protein VX061_04340, partial [Pseudomonadota bacterium]|nr:hypothetical protein [Pseudomonadota bacterium]
SLTMTTSSYQSNIPLLYYIYRPPTHKNTNKTHPRTQQSGIYPANPPYQTSRRRARVEQEGHLGGG